MTAVHAAQLVRELRRRAGLTQRELGRRSGTSGPTIAAYEAGTKEPRLSTLERLAEAAGQRLRTELATGDDSHHLRTRRRLRSLALAAAIADIAGHDWDRARRLADDNVVRMAAVVSDNRSRRWLDEWRRLLDAGPAVVRAALLDQSPDGDDLRQMHPFAGLLTDRERLAVLAAADTWGELA